FGDPLRVTLIFEGVVRELVLERRPARETVLSRERVLDVAQGQFGGGLGIGALETGARLGVVRAQRFEPALRFLLQVLEGARGRELSAHGYLPPVAAWRPLNDRPERRFRNGL